MRLLEGAQLGPYEIQAPIGAGGMGEVYRARDTRLDRTVAVKVLTTYSPALRERFEREGRAIAALQHPHICALFDVGSVDGVDFLVMEYLEGETLAQRLSRGPLPPKEAVRLAIEIADALDQAHRKGFVHRDLKPGNVMLTKSGSKLLDFGLAKMAPQPSSEEATRAALTVEGTVLGTIQYMSPEQLQGKDADSRSDLFSFGAVLYEMLTGRKAFAGKSNTSLMVAILEMDPAPVSASTAGSMIGPPATLDRVVAKCLAKDPDARWQTARDLLDELRWMAEGAPAAVAARPRRAGALALVAAAAGGALLAAGGAVAWFTRPQPGPPVVRFQIPAPPSALPGYMASISPDGRRIVFPVRKESASIFHLRPLGSLESRELSGTEGGTSPFWSPDGRWIGFFGDGKLKKIEINGGTAQALYDAQGFSGAWSTEGVILFAGMAGIFRVSATGGKPVHLTKVDPARQGIHSSPQFLPDGKHFLYRAGPLGPGGNILVGSLDAKPESQDQRAILAGIDVYSFARGMNGTGHIIVARDQRLLAQAFDPKTLRMTGEAVSLAELGNLAGGPFGLGLSASDNGVLVYVAGTESGKTEQVWFDRTGRREGNPLVSGPYFMSSLSPDETRVALSRYENFTTGDLWMLELKRGVLSRFTFQEGNEMGAVWSPDGRRVAFTHWLNEPPDLYQKDASGSGNEQLLLKSEGIDFPMDWSRDGKFLLYCKTPAVGGSGRLWILPLPAGSDKKPEPFLWLDSKFDESSGRFSPDGRWIAYSSNESNRHEVFVQSFQGGPAAGGKWQISLQGGTAPAWRADGKELYFLAPDGSLMAVPVKTSAAFEAGTPVRLFQVPGWREFISTHPFPYSVTGNGQKFLLSLPVAESGPPPVNVVLNWPTALR